MGTKKFCEECGKPLTPGALFCEQCGHSVKAATTPTPLSSSAPPPSFMPPTTPPPMQASQPSLPPVPKQPKKSKAVLIAALVVVGLLLVCGIGLFLTPLGKRVLSSGLGGRPVAGPKLITQEMIQAAKVIHSTMNTYAVKNGATQVNMFSITEPTLVISVINYHWNNGRGTPPGLIALVHQDKTLYGPWQAEGVDGQGGVPNAAWRVNPGVVLKPGIYGVVDSDDATWSQNEYSGGKGMGVIKGLPWREAKEMQ